MSQKPDIHYLAELNAVERRDYLKRLRQPKLIERCAECGEELDQDPDSWDQSTGFCSEDCAWRQSEENPDNWEEDSDRVPDDWFDEGE
jgi:hypothetical protein